MYKLEERPSTAITFLASLQWMVFIISGNLVVPLIIGHIFGLSIQEIGELTQRTIFLTGLTSLLQGLWGHRLPLLEGVAGMWWGVFIILGSTAAALGNDPKTILAQLQTGLICAGLFLVIIGSLGLINWLQKFFTPLVTGTYLILLALQLSGSFLKGMLGLENGRIDWKIAILSFFLVILVLLLSLRGKGWWKSMTALLGLVIGWGIFRFFHLGPLQPVLSLEKNWFALPAFFNWGYPLWDGGIVLTSLLTSLILISNLVASINAMETTLEEKFSPVTYKKGGIYNGIANILAGVWSCVGTIPLSISVGFIGMTGIASRIPFLIGCVLVTLVGLFPKIGYFFADIPISVAYSVTFVSFSQMIGLGLKNIYSTQLNERNLTVFSLSLITGIGVMFLPAETFNSLPSLLRYILGNGLLFGVLVVLALENIFFKQKNKS